MYPQDPHVHPWMEGPISGHFHFCIFCIRIYLPLLLSIWINFRFWPFIVYIQIVVFYDFAFCSIWLLLLLGISFRLCHAFFLWPGCQLSPCEPCHVGSGQTIMSTSDTSYNCHCSNYSSDEELQCQLMIILSLSNLSMYGNLLCYSTQWLCLCCRPTGYFALQEITGLFNFFLHPCSVDTKTLCSIRDKVKFYTCSLRFSLRETQAMAIPPPRTGLSRSIQRIDKKLKIMILAFEAFK